MWSRSKALLLGVVLVLMSAGILWGADLEPLKQEFETKKSEFDKVSNRVMDEFDGMWETAADPRLKAEVTLVRFALKENNRWAGRIDSFGTSGLKFDPYKANVPSEPRKTLNKEEKMGVLLKVPVELINTVAMLSGTYGLEDVLEKSHFCPEAGKAKDILKGDKNEFAVEAGDNPDTPLPLDAPERQKIIDLLKKNQAAYRALYEVGERLKEKIMRLRPADGFAYPEASLADFRKKMEELYVAKPEYKTGKASEIDEATEVSKISGLPKDELCKYQSYNGTMGLREITLCVPDLQHRAWLEVYFTMIGL